MKTIVALMTFLFGCGMTPAYSADAYIVSIDRNPGAYRCCTLQTVAEVSSLMDAARMDFEEQKGGYLKFTVRPAVKKTVYEIGGYGYEFVTPDSARPANKFQRNDISKRKPRKGDR
jgi:hypothetical protein